MRKLSLLAGAANGVMCLLVAIYSAFVLLLMRGNAIPVLVFCALLAGFFVLFLLASRSSGKLGFQLPENPRTFSRRVFFAAAGFSLFVSLVYLLAFFPGGFSSDTTTQWHQIRAEMPLSDWHPALHTMFLWFITRIVEHPAFVLLIQSIFYASAIGYATASMARWKIPITVIALITLYLSANPALSNIMTFPWKDCAFAISSLFLAVQLFEIHCSRSKWLLSKLHSLALAVTLTLCAILRHNGVALALAAGVWLLISCPRLKKAAAISVCLAAALFGLIKGPLYSAAGVEKNATPLDETIGLPMVILSHVYVNAPESLDEKTTAFLNGMGPYETYSEHHRPGDWNETKWFISPLPENHSYTLAQVFGFAIKAALAEPSLALEALSGLFDLPLLPAGNASWRMTPYVDPSAAQFGLVKAHQPFLSRALNWLCRMTASMPLSWLFWRPGTVLMFVMLACVLFARRRPLTALLLPAMIIAYHLATSVMLSSPMDFRFFLPTLMAAPLALVALYAKPSE